MERTAGMRILAGTVIRTLVWGWAVLGVSALGAEILLSGPPQPRSGAAPSARILFTPFGHSGIDDK